jgi:DEAD/DEAH box helicase domain-containing protein
LDWKETLEEKEVAKGKAEYGTVTEHSSVEGLKCIQFHTGYNRGVIRVQRDLQDLDTTAVLLLPGQSTWDKCREQGYNPLAGLLGLKNLLEETIPVSTLTDKGDVMVWLDHKVREKTCVAVLDVYPGGIGLAQKVFEMAEEVVRFAYGVIKSCSCTKGCPGCVGYEPENLPSGRDLYPDKRAAVVMLEGFLQETEGRKTKVGNEK